MSFLFAAVTSLHLLVLLLLFIVTLDKGWWVLPGGEGLNLWYDCAPDNATHGWLCRSVAHGPLARGGQGLLVGGLLLSAAAFGLFLWQLLGGPRRLLFLPAGGAQLLAGLAVLAGAGLLLLLTSRGGAPPGSRLGRCFALAAVGGALALASGGLFLRLRVTE